MESDASEIAIKNRWWMAYSLSVATLLIVAAAMKAWNAPNILAMDGLLSTQWLLTTAIGVEAVVAVLIVRLPPRMARILIVVVFGCFASVASYALFSGKDCNCFGFDLLGAWLTLPVDIIVLIAARFICPKRKDLQQASAFLYIAALAALLASAGIGLSQFRISQVMSSERLEFLLADDMIDKPWPIMESYHADLAQIETGQWLILIVRRDCEHCRELIEEQFHDPQRHRPGERTLIFIAGSDEWFFRFDHVSLEPGLESIQWADGEPFVASPAVFQVVDGIVKLAADSVDGPAFQRLWLQPTNVSNLRFWRNKEGQAGYSSKTPSIVNRVSCSSIMLPSGRPLARPMFDRRPYKLLQASGEDLGRCWVALHTTVADGDR